MPEFSVEVFQNQYLPPGGTKADAIVSVSAAGGEASAIVGDEVVEVIIVDASGSMHSQRKIVAAQKATAAAIDALRDDVWFAILEGRDNALQVYPTPGQLVRATGESRAGAKGAVAQIRAGGGTALGRWLTDTAHLVAPWTNARRHAILLTDGMNEEPVGALAAALEACAGTFECDCRGVGADWKVEELRTIAAKLLGTVDIIPEPAQMEAELRALMERSMARHSAEVALEITTPPSATVAFVKQVLPSVEDISARRVAAGDRTGRYAVGAWTNETRAYHVWVDLPPQEVGDEMLAARVSVLVGGVAVGAGRILAEWTDEPELSTRLHPAVAHFTGQTAMAEAIDRGLDALKAHDRPRAEAELGRAAKLAAEAGNGETVQLIAGIADYVDPATGTMRLRGRVDALAERILEAESTKTVAVRRPDP